MFIICPKCSAKYQIPEGISLEKGQKLKCSACDFVFVKGEEAPLVLESPVQTVSSTPEKKILTQPTSEAFSAPLYTASQQDKAVNSLPEAFQPIEPRPDKTRGLWLVPLYIFLIILLCGLAWLYRDSLIPSLSPVFPTETNRQMPKPKPRQIQTPAPVPELPVPAESVKDEPPPVPPVVPAAQPLSVPTESVELPPVVEVPTTPETVLPTEAEEDTLIILNVPEIEEIPLFEVVLPPPASAPAEVVPALEVLSPSFHIEKGEDGVEQLLIEGAVFNPTDHPLAGPSVIISVMDKDNQILIQKTARTAVEQILPGESAPFYTGVSPAPAAVDHIIAELQK